MNKEILSQALQYAAKGFSIIPVGQDKRPLIEWKEYQNRRATAEEIERWSEQFPDMNIGVVTGAISGIVVVDVEKDGSVSGLPATVIAKTGGGGWHFYYLHPGINVPNKTRMRPLIDLRGDGGYAVLPPSLHASGQRYEWAMPLEMADIVELPKEFYLSDKSEPKNWQNIIIEKNQEGTRNTIAATVAGKLVHDIAKDLWETAGWPAFQKWNNENNEPPLDEKELKSVWNSITNRHLADKDTEKKFNPITLSSLFTKQFEDIEWLAEGLIPAGGITAISGAPGSYKTWILLDLVTHVIDGENLFGKLKTQKTGVLIVDEENGERLFKERFIKVGGREDMNVHILSLDNFKLSLNSIDKINEFCKKNNIGLVIFDSLVRIHAGDENSARDMAAVAGMLKQIAKNGITVIFTHHNRKQGILGSNNPAQNMRGSSDILASVDCHLSVERKGEQVVLRQTKNRYREEINPFQLNFVDSGDRINFEYVGEVSKEKTTVEELKESVLNLLASEGREMYKAEILEKIKLAGIKGASGSFKTAMQELEESENIFTRKGERNKVFCSLEPCDPNIENQTIGGLDMEKACVVN